MPRNRYHSGPATDHFDGVRFFNNSPPTRDKSSSGSPALARDLPARALAG